LLVAHDKATGELIGEIEIERRLHGPIMSYQHEGRQYLAVAGGGRNNDAEMLVFALPDSSL
jgi:hypothetical protein